MNSRKFLKLLYFINTHPIWNSFMSLISWIYIFLAFFEPMNIVELNIITTKRNSELLTVEVVVLFFLIIDNLMDMAQRKVFSMTNSKYLISLFRNKKILLKTSINCLFLIDFLHYQISFPESSFRFSRVIRPSKRKKLSESLKNLIAMAIFYSKEMRRTFKGIIKSIKHMFDLLIFYLSLMLIWALVGFFIINNLDHQVEYEEVNSEF